MTTEQLKAFLDAHGVPGVMPDSLPDGHYAVEVWWRSDRSRMAFVAVKAGPNIYVPDCDGPFDRFDGDILRHAPLPDPGEVVALRARVAELESRTAVRCGTCGGDGWVAVRHCSPEPLDRESCERCGGSGAVLVSP